LEGLKILWSQLTIALFFFSRDKILVAYGMIIFAGSDIILCSSFQDQSLQTAVCDSAFSYLRIKLRLDVEDSIIFYYLKKHDSKMEKLMSSMTSDIIGAWQLVLIISSLTR
jgi:hypothetical protein